MNVRFVLRKSIASRIGVVFIFFATITVTSLGCGSHAEPAAEPKKSLPKAHDTAARTTLAVATHTASTHAAMRKWDRPIVCQPKLNKNDETSSLQGTGFFVQAPSGKLAAVSSAHFLDFAGPQVVAAEWLHIAGHTPVAAFATSWGKPGSNGADEDLTTDYWLMPVSDEQAEGVKKEFEVLEFDPRPLPKIGEPVWLPNKDEHAALGFTVFSGRVLSASAGIITIELERGLKLQSQSGSPILSRQTNKVIGTLASGVVQNDKTFLWLAPVAKMRTVLEDETQFPPLQTVIGKPAAP